MGTNAIETKLFQLNRDQDVSGVSGTGVVAEGVCFWDGVCVLRWHGHLASTGVYASIDDVIALHGHNGATRVVWINYG